MKFKKISALFLSVLILPILSIAQTEGVNNATRAVTETERVDDKKRVRTQIATGTVETRMEERQKAREKNQERIQNMKERTSERKLEVKNTREQKMLNMHQRMLEVFNSAITRLNTLSERIDSRIKRFESEGRNMTEAKRLLGNAQAKIDEAKLKLSLVSLSEGVNYENKEEAMKEFQSLRTKKRDARTAIIEAHRALILVIENMKSGEQRPQTTE